MVDMLQTDVLIVGAGLAGLMAAHVLGDAGVQTLVVDKGRSVGGRMATRRIGEGLADHGAQFFTVREPEFKAYIDRWLEEGRIFEWSRGWSDGSLSETRDGHPRYAARGGMNALAKYLAEGANVRLNTKIESISRQNEGWRAVDESGTIYNAKGVIVTAPVPQSIALIDAGRTPLSPADRSELVKIEYEPSLTAMFLIDGEVRLPPPGALQRPHAPIYWIGDNTRKGISPNATVLTAQAGPTYSRQLWERTDAEILSAMKVDMLPILGERVKIAESELKRWRYAMPKTLYKDRCLIAADLPPLIFAGDAFGGPRVEGAVLSGLTAGHTMAEKLK
jgi:renalase